DNSEEEYWHESRSNYETVIPEGKPKSPACYNNKELKGRLVCTACSASLDRNIAMAKGNHGCSIKQVLGALPWRKRLDLASVAPLPAECTVDRVLSEKAFGFHGKCVQWIQQMLPDKRIPSLVTYYDSWKNTHRSQTRVMDRQGWRLGARKDKEGNDTLEKGRGPMSEGDTSGDHTRPPWLLNAHPGPRKNWHCPLSGVHLSPGGLPAMSGSPDLPASDSKLIYLKCQVQSMKTNSSLHQALEGGIDSLFLPEAKAKFNNSILAVLAIPRYDKDFGVAEVIGSKTDPTIAMLRSHFNLEKVLQVWEAKRMGLQEYLPPMEEVRRGAPLPAPGLEKDDEVLTSVPPSVPSAPPPPLTPISLSQSSPLLRPPLSTAPFCFFLQSPLPALAASHHNRPGPKPPPTLIGTLLEPAVPSL
uniref:Uncharacterized protein n=1 Tax=Otolemur garnettii TaxID=30611 RepID=H0XZ29_OTOGA